MRNNIRILAAATLLILTACATNTKEEQKKELPPETLYSRGMQSLQDANYKEAIADFEEIERQHPASDYAAEAVVRKAHALYLRGSYDQAVDTIDAFLVQYPAHHSVAYMYYLKAICLYEQIADVGRDQSITQEAMEALAAVIERFPESNYARDAKMKLDLAFNQLAGKEMEVGRFYLNEQRPTAAINRFQTIVEHYNTSIFIPEALYRLTEIYYSLGVIDQAKKYAAVLGHNHPNTIWYTKAYDLVEHGKTEAETSVGKRIIKKIW